MLKLSLAQVSSAGSRARDRTESISAVSKVGDRTVKQRWVQSPEQSQTALGPESETEQSLTALCPESEKEQSRTALSAAGRHGGEAVPDDLGVLFDA